MKKFIFPLTTSLFLFGCGTSTNQDKTTQPEIEILETTSTPLEENTTITEILEIPLLEENTTLTDINTTLPIQEINNTTEEINTTQIITLDTDTDTDTNTTNTVYTLVIDEHFETYDESIWLKSDWANGDPFYNAWCPDQVDINNSVLTLNLHQSSCHDKEYSSGEYRTNASYLYGKYSTRFQASDVNGTITSFFTYTGSAEGTDWDEIDIEILGKNPTQMQLNYWRDGHEHPHIVELGFDASQAMHDYSFIFSPESIQWYVDEKLVYDVQENNQSDEDSLPINAGKIIINLWAATGIDEWSGHYEENTTTSAKYEFIQFSELQEE